MVSGWRPSSLAVRPTSGAKLRAGSVAGWPGRVCGSAVDRHGRARRRISPGPVRPYIFGSRHRANATFSQISAMMMLNEVYNRQILQLAASIPRLGRLEHPDATARAHSKLCGSTVTAGLKMDGDVVTDFAHDVNACALGHASSSIMPPNLVASPAPQF